MYDFFVHSQVFYEKIPRKQQKFMTEWQVEGD